MFRPLPHPGRARLGYRLGISRGVVIVSLVLAAAALPAGAGALRAAPSAAPAACGGLCETRRPDPSIALSAPVPRAGAVVALTASSPRLGVTYAWDLDGDGAFDDGSGARVTSSFSAGRSVVRVRAVDEDGRVGEESRTVDAHAGNLPPRAVLRLLTPSPSVAVGIEVTGVDVDGHVARIDADLDGDGSYETTDLFAAGEDAVASHSYRDPGPGMQTVHARVVDDAGAVGLVSAQVQVHVGNLDPFAGLSASVAGDRVSLTAAARDPEGAEPGYLWDLDGDGVYELDTAGVASASGSVPGAGSHEVGVRVLDGFGGETTVRRTVFVGSGAALDVVVPDARCDRARRRRSRRSRGRARPWTGTSTATASSTTAAGSRPRTRTRRLARIPCARVRGGRARSASRRGRGPARARVASARVGAPRTSGSSSARSSCARTRG